MSAPPATPPPHPPTAASTPRRFELERTVEHERVANEVKHWVRLTAACNSKCVFCLDAEAQDGRILAVDDILAELRRGREEKNATRVVLSGGEATIHPRFPELVALAKSLDYRWVQTVTNGQMLARREFFAASIDAGLDEITFSLHGHTPELHDRLTRTRNGYTNLMKAMLRAVRDGRPVVNVDVCINRENVEHLEAIIALCARVGVKEFDLLHIIPQGVAFEHRDTLFYDPDQHADVLRRVFSLARRPDFHIWTNRFPLAHLEGMEDLIQDPHKMLDEVGGRRVQFRRYLDAGTPIDCRDPVRCPHCFIEPFCSALDAHVRDRTEGRFEVWWVGEDRGNAAHAPPGVRFLGLRLGAEPSADDVGAGWSGPVYLAGPHAGTARLPPGSRRVIETVTALEALVAFPRQDGTEIEVHVDNDVAAWLVAHPDSIRPSWILHAPTRATMEASARLDPDWAALFAALPPGVRAQNLPACLAPGATLERPLRILDAHLLHHNGTTAIDPFVDAYIAGTYRAKSLRCRACPADAWCAGAHVQSIRAHGFRQLTPLSGPGATAQAARVREIADPPPRLRDGTPPLPPAPPLPVPGNPSVPWIDTAPGRRS